MVDVVNIKGRNCKYDSNLRKNLDWLKHMVHKKNFDGVFLIDGMEGSGKSELGKQCCLYLDQSFSSDDVVYTIEEFQDWVEKADPGKACLWDEFVLAGMSKDAMGKMNRAIQKQFTLIRKKNLFIVLIIPYFFMMDKYYAISRGRFLIHVYVKEGMVRGNFCLYTYTQKKLIYAKGRKTWIYPSDVSPAVYGNFTQWSDELLDEEKIDEKKEKAIQEINVEKEHRDTKKLKLLITYAVNKKGIKQKEIAKLFDLTPEAISKYISRTEEE